MFLQPGTKRFAEKISEHGKCQCKGNEQESPTGRFCSLKRRPGKRRREKRSDCEIGAAALVDSESAFACFKPSHRLSSCIRYIFNLKITEQVKASRVGMPCHCRFIFMCKDMKCGMFKGMIAPCFENKGKVKRHKMIIALNTLRHEVHSRLNGKKKVI